MEEKDKKRKGVVFNKETDVEETGRARWEEHGDRPHLQSHQQAHQQAKESQNQPWVDRLKFTTSKPTTPKTSGERNSIGIQISPSIEMPDIKTDTAKMEQGFNERLSELKAKTEEEQEAKHRKAEKMWSAIGDGISAIANMATVGAGADSMYNPADSLHSKVKSKWDEIKANKAAIAAANRKAQMDLLLKDLELGAKAKEAEANRNFNIWKTETEEAGRNQRAKEDQEFKASEKQKDRDNDKEVAKIRGKYSRSSGGGSSSEPKFYATNPNGGRHTWKSPQQGVGEMIRWMQANGYQDNIPKKGLWEDIDTRYANVYAAYEDAVADWQSKQSKPTPTKPKDNAAVTP